MTRGPGVSLTGSAHLGRSPLFSDVHLPLVAGGWTCLLGASGVGKSTILRLIAGLETGATFDGRITATDGGPVAPRVAYMAQDDLLLPWLDVTGNVALGDRLRGHRPDRARATDLIERVGLEPLCDRRPATLSGGQRQRVALARTLMEDRPIVLLDEPFSALDARTRADMQDLAATTLAGATVLLVTHEPSEAARLGDAVWLMNGSGVHAVPDLPDTRMPRPASAAGTLRFQARLLDALRAPAA